MKTLQPMWATLVSYDTDNPEHKAVLEELLTHNQQLSMQLNNILADDHKDLVDAKSYIDLYKDK